MHQYNTMPTLFVGAAPNQGTAPLGTSKGAITVAGSDGDNLIPESSLTGVAHGIYSRLVENIPQLQTLKLRIIHTVLLILQFTNWEILNQMFTLQQHKHYKFKQTIWLKLQQ